MFRPGDIIGFSSCSQSGFWVNVGTLGIPFWSLSHVGIVGLHPNSGVPVIYDENHVFRLGKASVLRQGKDVTIMAIGTMVQIAEEAAEILAGEAIEARILNMSSVKPIDKEAIEAAAIETGAIVTAEEHSVIGGLGSAVAETVCEISPAPVVRVGVKDQFGRSGEPGELMAAYGLTAEKVAEAAREAISRKAGGK